MKIYDYFALNAVSEASLPNILQGNYKGNEIKPNKSGLGNNFENIDRSQISLTKTHDDNFKYSFEIKSNFENQNISAYFIEKSYPEGQCKNCTGSSKIQNTKLVSRKIIKCRERYKFRTNIRKQVEPTLISGSDDRPFAKILNHGKPFLGLLNSANERSSTWAI